MIVRSKFRLSYHAIRQFCLFCIILFFPALSAFSQTVVSIAINGGINPASAEFIHHSIDKAQKEKAECLVIHLNTPGGLLISTRQIVTDILEAPVPVVVYVSPQGGRAASAGVFITMAAHIAAMAPGTNIGAAHPVSLQSGAADAVMAEKETNDAAALIRTIAEKRSRNARWAEDAVRQSLALTEKEALENTVINVIADNEPHLLAQIDGTQVLLSNGAKTLHTKNARVQSLEMGFFQKVLDGICDPTIAYLLMMLGFFGLLFELFNPGAILPGIAGVICLVFAFYAMSSLPVNYAGITLIVFGILLFLLEIKIISHGLLAIGGVISILLGSMFLFRSSAFQNIVSVSWSVILTTTVVTALFFLFVVGMGIKAQRHKPVTGKNGLIGKTAITLVALNPSGQVQFKGEIWNAVALSHHIRKNQEVIIKNIKALTLYVEQVEG